MEYKTQKLAQLIALTINKSSALCLAIASGNAFGSHFGNDDLKSGNCVQPGQTLLFGVPMY